MRRALAVVCLAVACAPSGPTAPDADAPDAEDASTSVSCAPGATAAHGSTCAPTGDGWCCPPGYPSCSCPTPGGFVADPEHCLYLVGACDVPPVDWRSSTDEHGCPILVPGPFSGRGCCLCADAGAPRDVGTDAGDGSGDAAADADAL